LSATIPFPLCAPSLHLSAAEGPDFTRVG
jgi:hypothetical protein